MQRLEVNGAVRSIYGSLGVKRLIYCLLGLLESVTDVHGMHCCKLICQRVFGTVGDR